MFSVSLMALTKQKPTVNTQENKEKGIKTFHCGKRINSKRKAVRVETKEQGSQETMVLASLYLSTIALM